ncbi:hypothetical protein E2562_032189 [Oryza meyeriana var. granulata]|uniref:Uncharacterized protein n=1 Tax=Oryza meyeriana var. granulata TaxID=110450 RepID=A0A6G1F0C7_9ORYZ|nr:hypothetical protein E2562_032189 [Oryza meyeriana var. granulata]
MAGLNTVWYDAVFPVSNERQLELDMIGRKALIRAERWSLAGLVAGLRGFAGGDDDHSELDAILYLLYTNGNIATAMAILQQAHLKKKPQQRTRLSGSELYQTMAMAAKHPSADALQEFLTSEHARVVQCYRRRVADSPRRMCVPSSVPVTGATAVPWHATRAGTFVAGGRTLHEVVLRTSEGLLCRHEFM